LHSQLPSVNARREKKDTRTKKQRMRADRLLKKKIENQKKYFCYYNSQSASAAVLSFKLSTTTTYNNYLHKKN